MAAVTICTVSQDNLNALRLTVDSIRKHNPDVPFLLWVWDNNSTDGTREWAEIHADRLFVKDCPLGHHHAHALDRMVQEVKTPYVMVLDNDVLTTGPVIQQMLQRIRLFDAFAVGPTAVQDMGTVDHFGRTLRGQPRIDPCYALFHTDRLARMVRHVSFTPAEVTNSGKFYDTGGMIRAAAEGAGFAVEDVPEVHQNIRHYGGMTWASHAKADTATARDYGRRVKVMQIDAKGFAESFKYDLVVARYNENVDWTANVPARVIVYDKSPDPLPYAIQLPNVGREAHVFAEHVARNYDDLAEVTVFAQGNPFDHAPDFLKDAFVPTSRFTPLGASTMLTGPNGDPCHQLPLNQICQELTGRDFPEGVPFTPGAQFAAYKSTLRKYPRTWWTRLAARLADSGTQTVWPWALERMWRHLLGGPPMAHFYHRIVGWFAAHDLYSKMVREASDGDHFVELGSWVGQSAAYMGVEIANSGKKIRFDAVDHFKGSSSPGEAFMREEAARNGGTVRSIFESNVAPVAKYINVVESDTVSAAELYEDNSLSFVFVDAGHSEEEVTADIMAFARKLKPGGWMGIDDYSYSWPGVIAACDKCFGYNIRFDARTGLWKKPS